MNYNKFYEWYLRNQRTTSSTLQVFFFTLDRTGVSQSILKSDILCSEIKVQDTVLYTNVHRQKKEFFLFNHALKMIGIMQIILHLEVVNG